MSIFCLQVKIFTYKKIFYKIFYHCVLLLSDNPFRYDKQGVIFENEIKAGVTFQYTVYFIKAVVLFGVAFKIAVRQKSCNNVVIVKLNCAFTSED